MTFGEYELFLRGRKLKDCAMEALQLLLIGEHSITGWSAWPVSRWLTFKGFVKQTLVTPPGNWRGAYEYEITELGKSYYLEAAGVR